MRKSHVIDTYSRSEYLKKNLVLITNILLILMEATSLLIPRNREFLITVCLIFFITINLIFLEVFSIL